MDGKGILHYTFGTGEYLDGLCMRKARIASGLEEAKPLPLWYATHYKGDKPNTDFSASGASNSTALLLTTSRSIESFRELSF
jgi:hypothetical protein